MGMGPSSASACQPKKLLLLLQELVVFLSIELRAAYYLVIRCIFSV